MIIFGLVAFHLKNKIYLVALVTVVFGLSSYVYPTLPPELEEVKGVSFKLDIGIDTIFGYRIDWDDIDYSWLKIGNQNERDICISPIPYFLSSNEVNINGHYSPSSLEYTPEIEYFDSTEGRWQVINCLSADVGMVGIDSVICIEDQFTFNEFPKFMCYMGFSKLGQYRVRLKCIIYFDSHYYIHGFTNYCPFYVQL